MRTFSLCADLYFVIVMLSIKILLFYTLYCLTGSVLPHKNEDRKICSVLVGTQFCADVLRIERTEMLLLHICRSNVSV